MNISTELKLRINIDDQGDDGTSFRTKLISLLWLCERNSGEFRTRERNSVKIAKYIVHEWSKIFPGILFAIFRRELNGKFNEDRRDRINSIWLYVERYTDGEISFAVIPTSELNNIRLIHRDARQPLKNLFKTGKFNVTIDTAVIDNPRDR